jgi:hypothetical protein
VVQLRKNVFFQKWRALNTFREQKMPGGRPMMHGQGSPSERGHCQWNFSVRAKRCAAEWHPGRSRDRDSFDTRSVDRQEQRQKQLNDLKTRPILWALRLRDFACKQKNKARRATRRPSKCFSVNARVRFQSHTGRWRQGVVEATCNHTIEHPDWAIVSVRRNVGAHDFEAIDMSFLHDVAGG